jgi:hypothetical protein
MSVFALFNSSRAALSDCCGSGASFGGSAAMTSAIFAAPAFP